MRDLTLIVTRGHVQAHERFAGPGHARHKHDRLPPLLAGSGDDPLHRSARDCEVHGPASLRMMSCTVWRASQDGDLAAKQAATRLWWEQHRHRYELVTSSSVLDEARSGDRDQSSLRLASLSGIHVLTMSQEVEFIGSELLRKRWIPVGASLDAFHVAFASAYQVNFLLTWNCSHLANEDVFRPIERWLRNLGKHIPAICTPTHLIETDHDRETHRR